MSGKMHSLQASSYGELRVKRRVKQFSVHERPRKQNYAYRIFQQIEMYYQKINIMHIKIISSGSRTDCF